MWIQTTITENRLKSFCHLLGCYIRYFNFIEPSKMNNILDINRENPERALELLINELKCLKCSKPVDLKNYWK